MFLRIVFLVSTLLAASCAPAFAQSLGGFGTFSEETTNEPESFHIIPDPTGSAPESKVYSFTITPGLCSKIIYQNGK